MTTASRARERLAGLPTAAVSDALDRLDLTGQLLGIGALHAGTRACGPAFTARYEPITDTHGTVGDFLDDVPPGAVVVIDNDGRLDVTVWGGIMTGTAQARGIAATVVHGACRDVAAVRDTGYPIWSSARWMRTGKDRVRLVATGVPLDIGNAHVEPGDLVCADDDGAVVIPAARVDEVADLAGRIEDTESRILEAVGAGSSLRDARAAHGYHHLQTRSRA